MMELDEIYIYMCTERERERESKKNSSEKRLDELELERYLEEI